MTTRVITSSLSSSDATTTTATTSRNGTTTIRSKSLPSYNYLVCDDPNNHSPFVNPTASSSKKGEKKNDDHQSLSLSSPYSSFRKNWRWPSRSSTYPWILQSIALFDTVFVSWWLMYALNAYHEKVPLSTKRQITFAAWDWYVWMHNIVVCEWMGFYKNSSFYKSGGDNDDSDSHNNDDDDDDDAISDEFKALSTLLYPTQFFPVSVPRIRFALSQLNAVSLNEIPSEDIIERIECDRNVHNNEEKDGSDNGNDTLFVVPESQRDHQTVLGLYINNKKNENEKQNSSTQKNKTVKKKVLFWIYGGAYLAGDAEGNLSLANEFMTDCDADSVFIPSYRLAPEATINDVLWDICWSYRYLLQRLQKQQKEQGEEFEIVVVGISSGGALALRLLQLIRDRSVADKKLPLMPSFLEPLIDDIVATTAASSLSVAGAVLFGPYVDYQDPQPSNGSFLQNAKYDWIVNDAVQHYGLPYLNGFIPPMGDDLLSNHNTNTNTNTNNSNTNGRIQYSPLSHEMNDLPPLCLIASEHEACYDMTIEVVNKVRRAKTGSTKSSGGGDVDVTIGVWKHMCHVFSMCQAFLPEGKASIEFAKEWVRTKTIDGDE